MNRWVAALSSESAVFAPSVTEIIPGSVLDASGLPVAKADVALIQPPLDSSAAPPMLQLRREMCNAFDQTQFSAFDTAARFDGSGRQVNGRFGEFTAARLPRQMQFALRFFF